ncbi:FmdB family zinc ribbon protein [Thiohalorhabdus sp.]|uniref:FmdB family zinc ribbon protein n=1 Tax=Thiohalorhabdus sp. TaxID=3094134 RepID=UPI003FCC67EE
MPLFDFECPFCHHLSEHRWQAGTPQPTCPNCGHSMKKQVSAPAVHGAMAQGRESAVRSLVTGKAASHCCGGSDHRQPH